MQTNHLSHFLLTKELFPLLNRKAEAVGEARIVNHSSIAAFMEPEVPLDAKYFGKNGGSLQQTDTHISCIYSAYMHLDMHTTIDSRKYTQYTRQFGRG